MVPDSADFFSERTTDYHVRPTSQDQEKAPGRNRPALARTQRRASQGDCCRSRPRRPLRKRRVQIRQRAPGLRQPQDHPSQEAHGRSQHAEPQQHPEGPFRTCSATRKSNTPLSAPRKPTPRRVSSPRLRRSARLFSTAKSATKSKLPRPPARKNLKWSGSLPSTRASNIRLLPF